MKGGLRTRLSEVTMAVGEKDFSFVCDEVLRDAET